MDKFRKYLNEKAGKTIYVIYESGYSDYMRVTDKKNKVRDIQREMKDEIEMSGGTGTNISVKTLELE